ncbi:hypothetical protein E4634_10285 [Mangrovimicrobium sediminis]|uniref:SnoaL-like domain-containing protein n=1 Tax=Mangrovimicrobium sediminis TaxID=2562682 RepID=A0A4Z0M151_9GAMM|nr:hypothetical protein [Haliea sp. SAOS-164]TGD73413.1 hypothetical protein E4634_10285 [Haliea sp. SAOS-164]
MSNTSDAAGGELSGRVLRLIECMHGLVQRGKRDGDVEVDDWLALADIVEIEGFERIGPFHDALDWQGYTEMLTGWVNNTEGWDPVVKQVSEAGDTVFVQCEEMLTQGDEVVPFYSLSMYRFNPAGKICHIGVYMQQTHVYDPDAAA